MDSTNSRPTTKREQRTASVDRILDAALNLIVSNGYHATTVDQIAQKAGLTKGGVYNYFQSKSDMLLALLTEIEGLIVDSMIERVAEATASSQDKLVTAIHTQGVLAANKAKYLLLFILVLMEFSGTGDPIEQRVRAIYKRFIDTIEGIVETGKRAGEFRADLNTKELAAVILALEHGTLLEWYCRAGELNGKELVRAARTVLLNGITKDRATE
ncbi:MAG: TetR/AcrR family transcriptional regulator [Rhizobiaceae bacterium]